MRASKPASAPTAQAVAMACEAALARAALFVGATAPNPPVGCAVLDATGNILACEAHARAGTPHAEALALARCRQIGAAEAIHTLVVTLEPCNHHGRTPPCTEAILATSARHVWIGAVDPNPGVSGGGAARLAGAGLQVRSISELEHPDAARLAAACRDLIAPFAKRMLTGLPWVTVKQALDPFGSMIPPRGQKTFTSPASLELAHALRRRADAILTGSGTILADAPEFTVRLVPDHPDKRRLLSILDRRGRTPQAYLDAARARGFEPRLESDLAQALAHLGAAGVLEVLVEAGPQVLDAVLASGLWDEQVVIIASGDPDRPDTVRRTRRSSGLAGE